MPISPPPQQQGMIFFVLVFIFFLSSLNHTTSLPSNATLSQCLKTFDCANIHNIPYPFTGADRPAFCGLPEFRLTCRSDFPQLNISSVSYRVLHLDPIGRVLTLARIDLWNETCTYNFVNSTFDFTNFRYGSGNENLTLFYGCSPSSVINVKPKNLFECEFKGNRSDSYALIGPLPADPVLSIVHCDTRVEVPILQSEATKLTSNPSLLREVLMKGFNVNYSSPYEHECLKCVDLGGQCGFDYDMGEPICICRDRLCPSPESTQKLSWRLKIAIVISAGVGGIALISILIIYNCKKRSRTEKRKIFKETGIYHHHSLESFMKNYGSLAPRRYSYSEVKRMTKSFSDKLGQGAYGVVYKASLPNGRLVAIKVIKESKGSGEEFLNEVASISRTSHVNVVTLLGFCYERNKRALIYEYMSNGSLDNFIYKRGSPNAFCTLEWKALYQITIGIAQGLEYLHRGCNTRILHLDIKPQNILLDEDFCPKISDFGLAKICQKKESIVSLLGPRGTVGFIAPEIFSRAFGGVSHKSDVYSYGMLVLEMIGGRKNYDSGISHTDEMYFPDWIYKDLEQGNIPASSLSITEEESELVRKMTLVSLWCIQTNPSERPAMSKVVEMLEGPLQSLSFPPKPTLQSPTRLPLQLSNGSSNEILQTSSMST